MINCGDVAHCAWQQKYDAQVCRAVFVTVSKDPGHGRGRDGEEEAHNRSMQRNSRSIPVGLQEERGQVGT